MLLWEALAARDQTANKTDEQPGDEPGRVTRRLPFDTRCAAITKSGKRCRGKIREAREFCAFHDPELIATRRHSASSTAARRKRRLKHLPGGYLRKLSDRRAVGTAMDRIYREVRLGVITPEMGRVLFMILCRLLDSGLADEGVTPRAINRTKAERMRPRLEELLTRAERVAWRKAIVDAPPASFDEIASASTKIRVIEARPMSDFPRAVPQKALPTPVPAAS